MAKKHEEALRRRAIKAARRAVAAAMAATVGIFAAVSPANAESCGAPARDRLAARAAAGAFAHLEDWPGFVALRFVDDRGGKAYVWCGGTLIKPDIVLTAAHCVEDLEKTDAGEWVARGQHTAFWMRGFRMEIARGRVRLNRVAAADLRQPAEIERNPRHKAGDPTSPGDVALIRLDRPISGVALARLADVRLAGDAETAVREAYVAGFGITDLDMVSGLPSQSAWARRRKSIGFDRSGLEVFTYSPRLVESATPLVPKSVCRTVNGKLGATIADDMLCAGEDRPWGADACGGDSGGPIIVYDRGGCPRQIGVVSFGPNCAKRIKGGGYGVYARLAGQNRAWIEDALAGGGGAAGGGGPAIFESFLAPRAGVQRDSLIEDFDRVIGEAARGGGLELLADGRSTRRVKLRQFVEFAVRAPVAGDLLLLDIRDNGTLYQLFPHQLGGEEVLSLGAGERIVLPPDALRSRMRFQAVDAGGGRIVAVIAPKGALSFASEPSARRARGHGGLAQTRGFAARPAAPNLGHSAGLYEEAEATNYLLNLLSEVGRAKAEGALGLWAGASLRYEVTR